MHIVIEMEGVGITDIASPWWRHKMHGGRGMVVCGGRGSGGGDGGSANAHDAPYARDRAWHGNPLGNPHGVVDVWMDDGREGDDVWE